MSDTETNTNNKQENYHLAQRVYGVCVAITGTALFIGSLMSLDALTDEARKAENTHIKNNYNKFTALCAGLFGAELLGGSAFNHKADNKKAESFAKRLDQEKAAPAPSPSSPSR